MAHTTSTTRVVGNPGRIIGFQLGSGVAKNPGKKRSSNMAKTKKRSESYAKGSKTRHNRAGRTSTKHHSRGNPGHRRRRVGNPGMGGSVGSSLTNGLFVIVGAFGSKLGAQAALGANNTGPLGYLGNALAGGILWFLTSKLMKNKAASDGVISGTVVQILLRAMNDYTPFGSYLSGLGMGDYQAQSFVTPQVLVDPLNSAQIQIPAGWGAPPMIAAPAAAMAAGGGGTAGMSGLYSNFQGGGLY